MDITFGIDQVRVKGKDGSIYSHELAARNFMFDCNGVVYSMFDVAFLSGIRSQRIKGAIEGARALRGLNSKTFEQCSTIAALVAGRDDKISKDIKTILANRKVRE